MEGGIKTGVAHLGHSQRQVHKRVVLRKEMKIQTGQGNQMPFA
jgi:hypothetical protein